MKSMNRVQLIGYLGKDPEIFQLVNGSTLARLRMATDQWMRQPQGDPVKITSWHTIKIWGRERVEKLAHYLIKGSHILVEGRIIYRTYPDKTGHTRYVTEINASQLVDLDR